MAHKRLTNDAREAIADYMVLAASKESRKAIFTEEVELFMEVRDFVLGKHKEAFLSLPERFVNTECIITVRYPEDGYKTYHLSNLTDPEKSVPSPYGHTNGERENIPFPAGYQEMLHFVRNDKGPKAKLGKKLGSFFARRKEFSDKYRKLEGSTKTALIKLTTTKRLKEEWPEAYDAYVKQFGDPEKEPKANLPMVPTAKVNAMLKDFPDSVPAE